MVQSAAASHIGDDCVTLARASQTADRGVDANWSTNPSSPSKLRQLNSTTEGTTMTAADNSAATTVTAPQWSEQSRCFFCPLAGSACLLVSTVSSLSERIARLVGIAAPFAARAEAICRSCLRNLDELEQANLLRDLMRGHFESQHGNDIERELGFAYVLRPSAAAECSTVAGETMVAAGTSLLYVGGGKGEASSSRRKCGGRPPMSLGQSRALIAGSKGLSISDLPTATVAEDQCSQMSSCDDGSSTSNCGGNGGGGASGGPADAASRCQRKIYRKRYSCRECNKVFGAKSHYDDHVTKHSNTKQFSCPLCGKAFKFKRGLREHVRDTHPDRGLESLLMLSGMVDSGLTVEVSGEPGSAARVKPEVVTEPTGVDGCDDGGALQPPVLQDSSAVALPNFMPATNASVAASSGPATTGGPSALLAGAGKAGGASSERDLTADDVPPPLDDECHDDVDFKDRDDGGDDDDEDGDEDRYEDGESDGEGGTDTLRRADRIDDDQRSTAGKARSRKPGSLHLHLPMRKRPGLQQQRQQCASPDVLVANSPLGVGGRGSGEVFGAGSFPCTLCSSRFKYKRGLVSHLKRKHLENEGSTASERKTAVQMLDRLSNPRLVASAKKRAGQTGASGGCGKQRGPVAAGRDDARPIRAVAAGFVRGAEAASDGEDDDDAAPLRATFREASLAGEPERQTAKDWLAELKQSADKRRQGSSSCSAGRSGSSLPQASSPTSASSNSNCSEEASRQPTATTAAAATVGRAGKATRETEERHEQSLGPDDSTSSETVKRTGGSTERSSGSKRLRLCEAVSTVRA